MRHLLAAIFLFFFGINSGQTSCAFVSDTLTIPKENKLVDGEVLTTILKNKNAVEFIKADNGKLYLKLTVSQNLYFDKIDVLEIRSGSKSFYVKDTKQYQRDKNTGFFVVELFKNYVATLKDDGITSIYFNQAETPFTRQDCVQIKQIAKCFYDAITPKK